MASPNTLKLQKHLNRTIPRSKFELLFNGMQQESIKRLGLVEADIPDEMVERVSIVSKKVYRDIKDKSDTIKKEFDRRKSELNKLGRVDDMADVEYPRESRQFIMDIAMKSALNNYNLIK